MLYNPEGTYFMIMIIINWILQNQEQNQNQNLQNQNQLKPITEFVTFFFLSKH